MDIGLKKFDCKILVDVESITIGNGAVHNLSYPNKPMI